MAQVTTYRKVLKHIQNHLKNLKFINKNLIERQYWKLICMVCPKINLGIELSMFVSKFRTLASQITQRPNDLCWTLLQIIFSISIMLKDTNVDNDSVNNLINLKLFLNFMYFSTFFTTRRVEVSYLYWKQWWTEIW